MEIKVKTQAETQAELEELNACFSEFLHTKGIGARFRLAFANMKESAKRQHAEDVARLEAVKAESAEQNADFIAFLKAKGFKAKLRLVIEGIKRGAANASKNTAAQIAKVKADTAASVARAGVGTQAAPTEISAEELAAEFNKYLAKRGLDGKFTLTVVEE